MKSVANIYQFSLLLPLAIPILFAPALYLAVPSVGETLGLVVLIIVFSGIIGGLPYVILAAGLAFWMRNKNEKQIRGVLALSPLFMIALLAIALSILRFVPSDSWDVLHSISGFFGMLGVLSFFTVVFGYVYVLIVFGIARWLREPPFESPLI